jgi:excisionase family DNA binding protein
VEAATDQKKLRRKRRKTPEEFRYRIEPDGMISLHADDFLAVLIMASEAHKGRRLGAPHPDAKFLSPAQAAILLGIGRDTVDRMIDEGQLPSVLFRKGRRKELRGISRRFVERWKEEKGK